MQIDDFAYVISYAGEEQYFGIGSYSAVSWSCRAIQSKMAKEKKFRDRIEKLSANIN